MNTSKSNKLELRKNRLSIPLTETERGIIDDAADSSGLTSATYARLMLLKLAKGEIKTN